ncbi:hypothetical protein CCPUN_06930 [Cardinium endosymbiont of Culicoides punctatus]|nr:hypothetical protein CCPUN_06930 [Cardinium endosymbiont of Culicoides punctatus]
MDRRALGYRKFSGANHLKTKIIKMLEREYGVMDKVFFGRKN